MNHVLLQGDCLEMMQLLPDNSIDMILCDLPYGTTRNKWDSTIDLSALWAEYRRICNGAIVLTAQTPFDKVLGASNIGMLRYEWIWQKTKATGHLNANLQPMKNHENVLVFYKDFPTYNPQGLVRKAVPTIRKGGNNGTNYGKSDKDAIQEFENYPRSILHIPSEGKTVHPTQKPVALMEYLIRTYTNPGDNVLDNCMGSGTTGVACAQSGRTFVGIERDPDYFKIAKERVESAYKQAKEPTT
jgi:site-specific DNA-methyltransferase (adenine-specific)